MTQQARQQAIVELVKQRGFVGIDELGTHFNVTPQTLRRDLNQLAAQGKLTRHHGGAGVESGSVNASYHTRKLMNHEAKERIADSVAAQIPDGASLFINIGTTMELVAQKLLNHRNLQVVTNNIHVAATLSANEHCSVVIAAGEVRHRDGGIIGEATCDFISQFHMDYGIIGISGISESGALLDFDFREVKVAQAILDNARSVILAADHSKFGRHAMVEQGHVSQVNQLITDAPPPDGIQTLIHRHEINLTLV